MTVAHQWLGIIEEYRDRLPVTDATPVITLREGGTPLVRSDSLRMRPAARSISSTRVRTPPDRSKTVA
jgi:threonine synthase